MAAKPMEAWRTDPFLPAGYRPRTGPVSRPKPPIRDLPIASWYRWETPEKRAQIPDKPQPARRMAGIIVSDKIYAIIETNGVSEIVQPGDMLGDRLAVVDRIERDKVVLKTTDHLPKYLTVRMASAARLESVTPSPGNEPGAPGAPRGPGGRGYPGGPVAPGPMPM